MPFVPMKATLNAAERDNCAQGAFNVIAVCQAGAAQTPAEGCAL